MGRCGSSFAGSRCAGLLRITGCYGECRRGVAVLAWDQACVRGGSIERGLPGQDLLNRENLQAALRRGAAKFLIQRGQNLVHATRNNRLLKLLLLGLGGIALLDRDAVLARRCGVVPRERGHGSRRGGRASGCGWGHRRRRAGRGG